ncbi:MAG TPA: rod shape-determining protein MreD [Oceanospirillales bacterium]|nr:rod shape-determining protein MreD [Oceanospirillaceae bacterium]HBS42613.1 rod shape-determining protein MreD [Oceanospirillales bacterium]|tara:strand:+ start:1275 stop:1748 length:474 start_codon:yes stop_codon:yes gene_type:complete
MSMTRLFYALGMLFLAFVLEHLPLPPIIDWFQPGWILLVVTVLVLVTPEVAGMWLCIPLGLLLDIEYSAPLGLNVMLMAVYIGMLQLLYRRLYLFNILQQAATIFMLVLGVQVLRYWAMVVLIGDPRPVMLLTPAALTALMWPWVYAVGYVVLQRIR